MNRIFRSAVFYLILIIAVVWVFNLYRASADKPQQLSSVNDWVTMVDEGSISTAKFLTKDEKVVGDCTCEQTDHYEVFLPKDTIDNYSQLAQDLGVQVSADPQQGSVLLSVLFQFLPILIIVGFFFFSMQQMQGGGNRVRASGSRRPASSPRTSPRSPSPTSPGSTRRSR